MPVTAYVPLVPVATTFVRYTKEHVLALVVVHTTVLVPGGLTSVGFATRVPLIDPCIQVAFPVRQYAGETQVSTSVWLQAASLCMTDCPEHTYESAQVTGNVREHIPIPPGPVHETEYVIVAEGLTVILPDVNPPVFIFVPVQLVASVLLQVTNAVSPAAILVGLTESEHDAGGSS
jgi:hypothetical protein